MTIYTAYTYLSIFVIFQFSLGSSACPSSWPYIDVNVGTMISADFATAAVLISFGVVLGVTSPLQLIVMTVLEIIIFVFNEIIGRDIIGAVDAGDIFLFDTKEVIIPHEKDDGEKMNMGMADCRTCCGCVILS